MTLMIYLDCMRACKAEKQPFSFPGLGVFLHCKFNGFERHEDRHWCLDFFNPSCSWEGETSFHHYWGQFGKALERCKPSKKFNQARQGPCTSQSPRETRPDFQRPSLCRAMESKKAEKIQTKNGGVQPEHGTHLRTELVRLTTPPPATLNQATASVPRLGMMYFTQDIELPNPSGPRQWMFGTTLPAQLLCLRSIYLDQHSQIAVFCGDRDVCYMKKITWLQAMDARLKAFGAHHRGLPVSWTRAGREPTSGFGLACFSARKTKVRKLGKLSCMGWLTTSFLWKVNQSRLIAFKREAPFGRIHKKRSRSWCS